MYFAVTLECVIGLNIQGEPADLSFAREYSMHSQNTENTSSADGSRKAPLLYFLKSFTLSTSRVTLHVIYQRVSCFGV